MSFRFKHKYLSYLLMAGSSLFLVCNVNADGRSMAHGKSSGLSNQTAAANRAIFMLNHHLINRVMDYNNISRHYPNISTNIANEIKDDLHALNGNSSMIRMTEESIFYLINIVLDSNGNVKSYGSSFRSAWGI
jgi:hypothetical protein